jgi:hypothetical protein
MFGQAFGWMLYFFAALALVCPDDLMVYIYDLGGLIVRRYR